MRESESGKMKRIETRGGRRLRKKWNGGRPTERQADIHNRRLSIEKLQMHLFFKFCILYIPYFKSKTSMLRRIKGSQ